MLQGQFKNLLDDKGRLNIPTSFRSEINLSSVIITRGAENCLWCFTKSEWDKMSESLLLNVSPYSKDGRAIVRRFISPAQEVELDKSGRILIPQNLREVANIKREVIVSSMATFIEIWSQEEFSEYENSQGNIVEDALEKLDFIKMR